MNITDLTAAQLKQAITLLDKKEGLQRQITAIDEQLSGMLGEGGTAKRSAASSGAKPAKQGRPGRPPGAGRGGSRGPRAKSAGGGSKRGDTKVKVMAALKEAGDVGLSIKELADKLKIKGANLYAWFGSTGKKITEIQKIGPAKYKMTGGE